MHEIEYTVVAAGETVADPAVALPVEKFVPVHEVAFVEDQVSVEEFPEVIEEGLALNDATGAGVGGGGGVVVP